MAKGNRNFSYQVKYYLKDQLDKTPATRVPETVYVDATSVPRAISKAKTKLELESGHDWLILSVKPVLTDVEKRRYQLT